jgi:plasmid stabilization system protein ParE
VNEYTVLWTPTAERDLADLWGTSDERNRIADAADSIDRALKHDPFAVGESRSGGNRIIFEPPLAVIYKVREADRIVLVTAIWRTERRNQ